MIRELASVFKRKLQGRLVAYNKVFDRDNQYTHEVLMDLAKFCRAHDTTFHPDPRVHAALEGRREVFLRIQQYLLLSVDEIYDLHRIKEIKQQGE